jgi:hypothetical protein
MRFNGWGLESDPPCYEAAVFVCNAHGFFTLTNDNGLVAAL